MAFQKERDQKSTALTVSRVWWVIAGWLVASLTIYGLLDQFVVLIFTATFGVAYPLAVHRFSTKISGFIKKQGLQRYPIYAIVAFLVSMVEE